MRRFWFCVIILLIPLSSFAAVSYTLQNAATANSNGSSATVNNPGDVGLTVTITGKATVNFEGSIDAQVSWSAIACRPTGGSPAVTFTKTSQQFICHFPGLSHLRTPIIDYQSGTVTVKANSQE